jgi:hypothetical protein
VRTRNYKDLEEENVKLVSKLTEVEMDLQVLKEAKKKMKNFQRD